MKALRRLKSRRKVFILPVEIEHATHGNESNDISYVDTSYKPERWEKIAPKAFGKDLLKAFGNQSRVRSLRELCARVLADHSEDLDRGLMSFGTYNGAWKLVWQMVCADGHDSFELFDRFAKTFGSVPEFQCHAMKIRVDAGPARHKYLTRFLSGQNCHRIEYLPRLPSFKPLTAKDFGNWLVFLDLSHIQLTGQQYLEVMSLRSLVALDVSGASTIPESVLVSWRIAMRNESLWANLRMLCLGNASPSERASQSLLECDQLVYLECPRLNAEPPPQWSHASEAGLSERFVAKHGLVQKYNFLKRASALSSESLGRRIYLELVISGGGGVWDSKSGNSCRHCYIRMKWANPSKRKSSPTEKQTKKVPRRKLRPIDLF
ncbi:hypothetical protein TRVA0_013S01706 [Trichomonascus vanleenenianus]|uniref:uncharacterized protein n=1 Tax=Trichomonascus vanleenenianus TaxID=2268995 RepID=UPI003ECB6DDF